MIVIDTSSVELQRDVAVTVDGYAFVVRFQWLESVGRWSVDFLAEDETPILMGRRLIPGRALTNRYTPALPPGTFVAVRPDGAFDPIGRDEIRDVLFAYVTPEEAAAIPFPTTDLIGTLTYEAV